jgi:hypothetical protein
MQALSTAAHHDKLGDVGLEPYEERTASGFLRFRIRVKLGRIGQGDPPIYVRCTPNTDRKFDASGAQAERELQGDRQHLPLRATHKFTPPVRYLPNIHICACRA